MWRWLARCSILKISFLQLCDEILHIYNNAAGVKRVHDVSEQVAFRMLSGQRALLSWGDHFSQRTHPGKDVGILHLFYGLIGHHWFKQLITAKIRA